MRAPRAQSNRSEVDLHERVARLLDRVILSPAEWTTFPAGSVPLPPRFAAKLSRLGLKRGWPDILIVHNGVYGIELKRNGAKLSRTRTVRNKLGITRRVEGQTDVFPLLTRAGMPIAVCHSENEVMAALLQWRIPARWYVLPIDAAAD